MTVEMLNCDCMDYMKTLEDNAFELAIVDLLTNEQNVSILSICLTQEVTC